VCLIYALRDLLIYTLRDCLIYTLHDCLIYTMRDCLILALFTGEASLLQQQAALQIAWQGAECPFCELFVLAPPKPLLKVVLVLAMMLMPFFL